MQAIVGRIIREQRALRGAASGIFLRGLRVVPLLLELADIGAGDERLAAGAGQDPTRTLGSSRNPASAMPSPSHISSDIALRFSG